MLKKHESVYHQSGQYSLENLRIRKPTKSSFNSQLALQFDYRTNEKEMKVISPFYDRNKCSSKGPCMCPFHRKKRLRLVPSQKNKSNFSTVEQRTGAKYRKVNTEQCQKTSNFNKIKKNGHREQKQNKNLPYCQLQNYVNVAHKVQCRNSEFQNFLKKNELYILTGKFPVGYKNSKQNKDDFYSDEQFLQTIYNSFDADGNFYTDSRSRERKKTLGQFAGRDFNRKATRQKTYFKKFGQEGIINRMRALVQLIINGQKKMSFKSMGKLRNAFSTLIQQQKQVQENSISYLKNKQCLQNFDVYLEKMSKNKKSQSRMNLTGTTHLSSSKMRNSGNVLNKNHRVSLAFKIKQSQQNFEGMKIIEGNIKDGTSKGKNNSSYSKMVMFNMKNNNMNDPTENMESVNQFSSQLKNEEDIDFNSTERLQLLVSKRKDKTKVKKHATTKARNHSQLLKELSLGKNSKQMEKSEQNKDQSFAKSSNGYHQYQSSTNQKKNEKQAKLQQILNQIKDEQLLDANYLKMKKYIERNKKFIKKMEMKLLNYNLGVFVIEESDSLITRKKKIRCLKELLSNSENMSEAKKGFYDQIMKYLDIYTQHCNMVMKKEFKKKNGQDVDFTYEDEGFYDVLTSKDYNKSLKFINLYENLEFEKQKKLQGWISIPQYITNDETRLKTFQIQHKSVKRIERNILNQNLKDESEQSFDSLIQEEMNNKCLVQNYRFHQNTLITKNRTEAKHLKKKSGFICRNKTEM